MHARMDLSQPLRHDMTHPSRLIAISVVVCGSLTINVYTSFYIAKIMHQ